MNVLFVCVGNTCRSQMAEAVARDFGYRATSAGTHPPKTRGVAENAIKALNEVGIQTMGLHPKSIDSVYSTDFDKIISMGCGVSCPNLPIDEDWSLEDPFGMEIEAYRKTLAEIRRLVARLESVNTDA